MAQIFHRSSNSLAKVSIVATVLMLGGVVLAAYKINAGSFITDVNVAPSQPVPFSHKHHVGDDGIDCRYCHTSVETSSFAGLPPTETCMSCHSQIWANAELLEPVRASFRTGKSLEWTTGPRPAGFRLLQPQHSCEQRHWLLNLSRQSRPDAADV